MPTPPPALRSLVPGLSERGSAVIAKMMATSPGERFASLADAVLALEDTLTPSHPPSRTDAPPSLADTQIRYEADARLLQGAYARLRAAMKERG